MLRNNLVHNISEAASSYIRIGVININFKRELARIKVQSKYAATKSRNQTNIFWKTQPINRDNYELVISVENLQTAISYQKAESHFVIFQKNDSKQKTHICQHEKPIKSCSKSFAFGQMMSVLCWHLQHNKYLVFIKEKTRPKHLLSWVLWCGDNLYIGVNHFYKWMFQNEQMYFVTLLVFNSLVSFLSWFTVWPRFFCLLWPKFETRPPLTDMV